ncbi:hypothetical protein HAX54_033640 [Datura stramonium]|uniref:Gnk2-homologous domain-containing protein n=1 Tax=Datura stramonium TaxID=4076 RepID=A0ABS8SDH2_DATST|nr:hypothetical protein [Datura stramonium]
MAIQMLLLFLIIYLDGIILAQPNLLFTNCGNNGDYTQSSVYQSNLNTLLSSISSNMNNYGFYNSSIGGDNNMVSAIVLCRGDVDLNKCRTCVDNVAQKLIRSCPNKKEAFGGYDECMLQYYSGRPIPKSNLPLLYMWDDGFASKPEEFHQELKKLMDVLRGVAAYSEDPRRKYATGQAIDRNYQTIYALVQCTPDLSPQDCFDCLTDAYGAMATCPCNGNRGSRQIGPRCNFRYERSRFFKSPPNECSSSPGRT